MSSYRKPVHVLLALTALLGAGCQEASGFFSDPTTTAATSGAEESTTTAGATSAVPPPAAAPATTTTTTTAPKPPPPTRPVFPPKAVPDQPWIPFATVGGVVLHHPSNKVERIGFHESNHDGARQLEVLPTAIAPSMLESRDRGTNPLTAADIVADPDTQIRSPVTGTVKRGGRYTLYCDHRDFYVVIEPEQRPGWEVKLLHIDGLKVRKGARVVAGQTVLASRPAVLAFESQVDEASPTRPAWPHVHIEVVDPSIPDRPSPSNC